MYVATGFKKWGMSTAHVAGKIISDLILKKESKYANMYSEPDTSSEIIMQIPVGEQVKIIDDYPSAYSYYGQFNRIIYNDQDGYIENNYLMEDD